ncbi:probable streptothricin acetyltransferase A [Coccomyxa sp. Obi]|nr:probable streptothricin acetyltransferase A [Coccomyxa sp. Obi]
MADKEIVIVRRANLEDVSRIVELLEILFTIEADFCIDKEKQTRGVALLLSDKDACALVAVLQDKVVGCITIQRLISTAEGGYVGLVEDVVVEGQFRKKGIGKQLEKAACSWALENGLLRLQLLADSSNASALSFYSRLGWKETNLVALRKK